MGLFSGIIGVVKTIGSWIVDAGSFVFNVANKTEKWGAAVGHVTNAYLDGRNIVIIQNPKTESPQVRPHTERPDVLSDRSSQHKQQLDHLVVEISDNRDSIDKLRKNNELDHERIKLQMDIMELIIASQTVERFAHNIRLHVSGLNNHFETLKNTMGLLDYSNRQNKGLRATIKQLNHIIYHLKKNKLIQEDSAELIRDIDLSAKPGAISIAKQFEAFQNTRNLLEQECDAFMICLSEHLNRAKEVRKTALKVPDKSTRILSWLDKSVMPSLNDANNITVELKEAVIAIPLISTEREVKELSMEKLQYDFPDDTERE